MKKIPPYKDPARSVEERVEDLLRRMTLQEKTDQLLQDTIGRDANPNNYGPGARFNPSVGSILSFSGGAKLRNEYQRVAVEKTRLGIPILWGWDVIHGWRTGFPIPLAQAASFRPTLTEAVSRVAAAEAYADGGVNWTFSPMVEVCHDPRWGRVMEGYGEDPFTARAFTHAAVIGYQGKGPADWKKPGRMAACLKHFVGYSASEGGRDYEYTDVSARALWEWYLPPFEEGVAAGARTLMSSFNDIGGTPAVCNRYVLNDVLRGMWGFDGFVVSDWEGVGQLKEQGYSSDPDRQALDSLVAGNEMDMKSRAFANIPRLVESGALSRKVVDEAVRRVLRVKFEMGLFEHPYVPERSAEATCRKPTSLELSRKAARECAVLLKNERKALPARPKKGMRIAVVGPAAESRTALVGRWRAQIPVDEASVKTLAQAVREAFPRAEVVVEPGCSFGRCAYAAWPGSPPKDEAAERKADAEALAADRAGVAKAARAAAGADLVFLCVGEEDWMTGEYSSRHDICLPGLQEDLTEAVRAAAKGTVVALVATGRPLAIGPLLDAADAVLYLWQGGTCAADAALDLVTGTANPSGRLPMTFPRAVGQIPMYYNAHPRCRAWADDYRCFPNGPLLPFGYGLSYTTFAYGPVTIRKRGAGFAATVTVRNTGRRAGAETVFWYLSDPEATFTQPVRRVIGFEKVDLEPGEERTVTLKIDPMHELAYVTPAGERVLEPGDFLLSASRRSEARFTIGIDGK